MRMLIVADHSSVVSQIKGAVTGWRDTEILHVSTPARALALIDDDDETFDIVVGDNDTHPAGGLFLCREVKLRYHAGTDVPPVVLLLARPQDQLLANWAQADAHIIKPLDPFTVTAVLGAVLDGETIPELPGVGSDPTPSVLDRPESPRKLSDRSRA